MKFFCLAALIVAVTCTRTRVADQQWPWQVGKLYRYDVQAHTLTRLQEGASSGSVFKATFIVRVASEGRLQAKLENPQYAQVHQQLPTPDRTLPSDLSYQPAQNLEQPFEIVVDGGRVESLSLPSDMPLQHENLLKGLISTLQVDLSTKRLIASPVDTYDKVSQQGLFRRMEKDVTGDCETLYTISPVASEWRREISVLVDSQEPIEITKSKNYGHCHHRVAYHFGVPNSAEWSGTAGNPQEEQFIKRNTFARMLVARQGPIYKAETTSTVNVLPLLNGNQDAEVHSHVKLILVSYTDDKEAQWQKPTEERIVKSLLYSLSKQVDISDSSNSMEDDAHVQIEKTFANQQRSMSPKIVSINKLIMRRNHEDSSSSSSESGEGYYNDNVPRLNEPAYAAMLLNPQLRVDKKENSMNVQKLVQDIAQQLQNPNNMPKQDLLTKFNILVRLIASMSWDQLSQISHSFESAKSSNNIVKSDMWMVYRDAVVQAGTLPAFQQIRTWIQTRKIVGEEAAEVVATLTNTLRYPTKEVMEQFYQLAVSKEVRDQEYLNSTALIAATKFINMGQVNNETAYSYYPTYMYGRLARKYDNFVVEEILPELRQKLQEAIEQRNTQKALVYIKAIGNLGHRAILDVFAPYLEGKIVVSTYLRQQIVDSLVVLAHQKDKYVRAVLYSILRNTAEPYEVRVAAILNIFWANPTGAMMQAMAQMTHDDNSIEVRAALKSAIESAAELKNTHFLRLARTAQAARPMLTKKKFGLQYSTKKFNDYWDKEADQGIFGVLSQIGSENTLFPQYMKYSWRNKIGGWSKENLIAASSSNNQKLVQVVEKILRKSMQERKSDASHKYSAEKISEMLNIRRDEHERPLEMSLNINLLNQQRYFAFGESDIQQLSNTLSQYLSKLENGVEKHYVKVLNQAHISVMFPIAMGMPFIYQYKVPTIIHMQSKAKASINFQHQNDYSASIDKELQVTFARNIDGHVGFYDTLSEQYASAGVVNKFQLHVPMKIQVQLKPREVKVNVQPIQPDQDTTMIHYSVWPYTAMQKKDSIIPVSLDPSTKPISRINKVVSTDWKFGQTTGTVFQLQGYSYSSDYRNMMRNWESRDFLSNVALMWYQKDVALTHFNFRYLGKQSQTKNIAMTFVYDKFYNQKEEGENTFPPKDVALNSEERRKEIVRHIGSDLKVEVVDISAVFEGTEKLEYVMTAALGSNSIHPKVQYALYGGRNSAKLGNERISATGHWIRPFITSLNFLESLQKDLKSTFTGDFKFGNDGMIQIQGQAERSQKYTEALMNHPRGKQCALEIAQNNYYQRNCHKMIVKAHTPDSIKVSVNYKNVSPLMKNWLVRLFRTTQHVSFWNTEANVLKTSAEGKLDVAVQMNYLENIMNIDFITRIGSFRVKDIVIPKTTATVFSFYTPWRVYERVWNSYTKHQFVPYCTVDGKTIRTYSNRQYDYPLSKSWHVVVQDAGNLPRKYRDQLVVLTRRPSELNQEVYISYKSETGKDLELLITPTHDSSRKANVKVTTNSQKLTEGDFNLYWDDIIDTSFLQYYTLADGNLMLNIREDRLRVMYDGQRLVVYGEGNRNNTRGICGQMSGERYDDYYTPRGLVDKPEHYGALFALNDEHTDSKTQQYQNEAKNVAYQRRYIYTNILHSDAEWNDVLRSQVNDEDWSSHAIYRARSYSKEPGCKLQEQVQYYENRDNICISTERLPACQSHCRGHGYNVQAVQVVCRPRLDEQFRQYRDQIRQGQNPKVTGDSQMSQYRIPNSCRA